jgi:hypothetical protein
MEQLGDRSKATELQMELGTNLTNGIDGAAQQTTGTGGAFLGC